LSLPIRSKFKSIFVELSCLFYVFRLLVSVFFHYFVQLFEIKIYFQFLNNVLNNALCMDLYHETSKLDIIVPKIKWLLRKSIKVDFFRRLKHLQTLNIRFSVKIINISKNNDKLWNWENQVYNYKIICRSRWPYKKIY
jgi:hypothetical protein